MKNLFKKKQQSNTTSQQNGFKTPQKSKAPDDKFTITKTPPLSTPSPPQLSYETSSRLPIKVISNTGDKNMNINHQVQSQNDQVNSTLINELQLQQQVLYDSTSIDPYLNSLASASNSTSSYQSPTNQTSSTRSLSTTTDATNNDTSSILASLLNCASETVSDQYDYLIQEVPSMMFESQKSGLHTIPEETVNYWGVAPHSDDDDDDDDCTVELRDLNDHDNGAFECVLQNVDDEKNKKEKDSSTSFTTASKRMDVSSSPSVEHCRPCTDSYTTNTNINNTRSMKTGNNNNKNNTSKHNKNNVNGRKKILGKLFQKKSGGGGKANSTSKRSSTTKTGKKKKKIPKWKIAKDPKSNRIYFYHTTTQQVSWTKPSDFDEWKATLDKNTKKYYFYNVITKETTWEQPKEFVLWKKVEREGMNAYYYNVLTREVQWKKPESGPSYGGSDDGSALNDESKPNGSVGGDVSTSKDSEKIQLPLGLGISSNATSDNDLSPQNDNLVPTSSSSNKSNTSQSQSITSAVTTMSDKHRSDPINEYTLPVSNEAQIIITPPSDDASVNSDSKKSEKSGSSRSEPGRIVRSTEHEILRKLLFTYCPGEKENNTLLLSKSHGNEAIITKAVQSLIHETPFDELRLAIFSFVKETLKEMGEQPFDENKSLQKVTVDNGNDNVGSVADGHNSILLARNTIPLSNPSYAMHSKVFSTMTSKSTVSNSTQVFNNTTRSRGLVSNSIPQASNSSSTTLLAKNRRSDEGDNVIDQGHLLRASLSDPENYSTTDYEETAQNSNVIVELESMELVEKDKSTSRKKDQLALSNGFQVSNEDNFNGSRSGRSKERPSRFRKKKKNRVTSGNDSDESAYAADNDGSGDEYSFNDEALDDISALSDSLARPSQTRKTKEKKKNEKRSIEQKDQKTRSEANNWDIDTSWKTVSKFIAQVEDSMRSQSCSPENSIGYEEIPRTKVQTAADRKLIGENLSHSDWDDDTLSSNFCSEDDDRDLKQRAK